MTRKPTKATSTKARAKSRSGGEPTAIKASTPRKGASATTSEDKAQATTNRPIESFRSRMIMSKDTAANGFKGFKPAAPFKDFEEFTSFGKDNLEAWVAASRIAATGMEKIAGKWLALMTASVENAISTSKAAMACKDVKDLVELQTKNSQKLVDHWVNEGTAISELSVKTMTEALAPIGNRVNATVERVTKTVN